MPNNNLLNKIAALTTLNQNGGEHIKSRKVHNVKLSD